MVPSTHCYHYRKFLESFPSSIRHILPENKARPATPPLQRAESVDSDEMWHTTADLQSSSLASSTARVRKRRQVIKLQTDQGVDKLNKLLKSQDTLKGMIGIVKQIVFECQLGKQNH